jgi:hypothetical protein
MRSTRLRRSRRRPTLRARPCVAQRRNPPSQPPTSATAESAHRRRNGHCRSACLRLTFGPLNAEGATAPHRTAAASASGRSFSRSVRSKRRRARRRSPCSRSPS